MLARRLSLLLILFSSASALAQDKSSGSLTLVVMDPLSAPLACDCVKGYAQRKYEKLGAYLQRQLAQNVDVVWGETLEAAREKSEGAVDIVIGKHSVVLADAKQAQVALQPLARLTDLKGKVEQTGLFVVRSTDAAKSIEDLRGYRILFGPEDCDEKSAAPMAWLKEHSVPLPTTIETSSSCSNAAVALMELPLDTKAAAVISSYAGPLLEGCGKVAKGDLRVIGESRPVPFITLFVRNEMPKAARERLLTALQDVELDAQLLVDLETAEGFLPWTEPAEPAVSEIPAKKKP
jgi:ABC-type phosphate/phosphonate transport system substrate-binding protein